MRRLRSTNMISEEIINDKVITNRDRAVTGDFDNDSPIPIKMPSVKDTVNKVKKHLTGKTNSGDMNIHDDHSVTIINNTNIDNSVHHSGLADGLAWFNGHWKEVAIVTGAIGMIYAISKLIKGLNKSIKIRYNKVVRTLQRAQKDFTIEPNGLNMNSVMPGVGNKINDWISRMWSQNWKSTKHKEGNIGLHPFCLQYIEEIQRDFATAQAAFSKIKLGADESELDKDRNTDASVGGAQHNTTNVSTSVYSGKVYSSFHEAYAEEFLNEGVSPDKIDESVLAMISAGVALTSLAVRAGKFLYQRFKDGKPSGDPKEIQVTKESTREICYAIIFNYMDKYVNMKQVFEKLGISSQSLADLDQSSCDKLQQILRKYEKPEKNAYTKQYSRIEKAYRKMLKHYYAIGDGIISNFIKYSEDKDEKHANLIVASKEKLQNMWDSQKDFYDNNFSHVLIEIVSSEAYINYLDFIIEKVIPVFKSGIAGDADYVLDVVPKKGEYYLLRQTEGQPALASGEIAKGNVAIAEVLDFDRKDQNMEFRLIGLVKGEDYYMSQEDGTSTLTTNEIDYDVYNSNDKISLKYGKWLALDPVLLNWSPDIYGKIYKKSPVVDGMRYDWYLYAYGDLTNKGKYNHIVVITTKYNTYEILSVYTYKFDNYLSAENINKVATNKLLGFNETDDDFKDSKLQEYYNRYQGNIPKVKDIHTTDEFIEEVRHDSFIDVKTTHIFTKSSDSEKKNVFGLYREVNGKDVIVNIYLNQNNITTLYSLTQICNIDDFTTFMSENGFEQNESSYDNEVKIKDKIINSDDINGDNIEKLEDFTHAIEDKQKSVDYDKKIDEIVKWCSNDNFKVNDNYIIHDDGNGKKMYVINKEKVAGENVYKIDLAELNAGDGHLTLCPTIINKPNDKKTEFGVYIIDDKGNYQVTLNDSDSIKSGIMNILNKIKDGKELPKSEYILYVGSDTQSNNNQQNNSNTNQQNDTQSDNNQQNNSNTNQQNDKQSEQNDSSSDDNKKSTDSEPNESLNVQYMFDTDINESESTSTVTVNRTFNKRMRNWYVLSEAVYDDGSNLKSKLDKPLFVKSLLERSDCASFAKSSRMAKFMPYETKQTYTLVSNYTYSPSVATPLYESIVAIKLDKMDNVVEKRYLGKHRIG